MTSTEQETIELFVSLFEANITDPLTGRAAKGTKWIYDDQARLDLNSYPRISVLMADSRYEQYAVGDTDQLETQTIVVEVTTRKNDKITVGSITDARGEQIVDYLAKECKETIKNNHSEFITNGILAAIPETSSRSVMPGKLGEVVLQRLTFLVSVIN